MPTARQGCRHLDSDRSLGASRPNPGDLASNLPHDREGRVRRWNKTSRYRELVDAVAEHSCSEAETIATIVYMVNRGHVRFRGAFAGARVDLTSLTAW